MFSFKHAGSAVGVLSLALVAGCQVSQKRAAPPYAAPTSPAAAPVTVSPGKAVQLPPDSGNNMAPNILDWDETVKKYYKQPGDFAAKFTFSLTNVSAEPVMIYATETTCECTVAKL